MKDLGSSKNCDPAKPLLYRYRALQKAISGPRAELALSVDFVELVLIKSSRETLAVKSFSADHTGK